jgi:hypothetical protein
MVLLSPEQGERQKAKVQYPSLNPFRLTTFALPLLPFALIRHKRRDFLLPARNQIKHLFLPMKADYVQRFNTP